MPSQQSPNSELAAARELAAVVRRLGEIAEADLGDAAKLELLIVQIGAALFWADRISSEPSESIALQGPHYGGVQRPCGGAPVEPIASHPSLNESCATDTYASTSVITPP